MLFHLLCSRLQRQGQHLTMQQDHKHALGGVQTRSVQTTQVKCDFSFPAQKLTVRPLPTSGAQNTHHHPVSRVLVSRSTLCETNAHTSVVSQQLLDTSAGKRAYHRHIYHTARNSEHRFIITRWSNFDRQRPGGQSVKETVNTQFLCNHTPRV